MPLIDTADRLLYEAAADILVIAEGGRSTLGRGTKAAIDAASAGLLSGVSGAFADSLTGDSADKQRRIHRRARVVLGHFAEMTGAAIRADIDRRGLSAFFDAVAGDAPVTRWSDSLGNNLAPLRGVPRGEGQRAAGIYMNAAAPAAQVSVPARIYQSPAWALMLKASPGFSEVGGRFVAVMAAIDAGGLPQPAAGAQALQKAYPTQWRSSGARLFESAPSARQEAPGSTARRVVPSWPSAKLPNGLQTINPATGRAWIAEAWFEMSVAQRVAWLKANGLPVEYAYADGQARYKSKKAGGGALPLAVGVLTVTGLGAAAALKYFRRPKRRIRGRRR